MILAVDSDSAALERVEAELQRRWASDFRVRGERTIPDPRREPHHAVAPQLRVAPALVERVPIGEIFDRVFSAYTSEAGAPAVPSGRSVGNIGKLSLGVLPRSEYARQAVVCALVRFLHPALYDREPRG